MTGSGTADEMRKAFDDSFSSEVVLDGDAREDMLVIRSNGSRLALRASEIAEVLRCPRLTVLPARMPLVCGLVGVRGALVAVFSLAALRGESRHCTPGGWIFRCAAERSVAFSFDELVGYSRVRRRDVVLQEARQGGASREIVVIGQVDHTVSSVAALLKALHAASTPNKDEE